MALRGTACLFAAIVLSASFGCNAASVWHTGPLALVYPMSEGSFVVGFNATDAPACSSAGAVRYMTVASGQNGVTSDGVKSLLATVLTAFGVGSSVSVVYDDSTTNCYVNRLLIQ